MQDNDVGSDRVKRARVEVEITNAGIGGARSSVSTIYFYYTYSTLRLPKTLVYSGVCFFHVLFHFCVVGYGRWLGMQNQLWESNWRKTTGVSPMWKGNSRSTEDHSPWS